MSAPEQPELKIIRIPAVWVKLGTSNLYRLRCGGRDMASACGIGGEWYWSTTYDTQGTATSLAKAKQAVIARLKEAACQR